MTPIGTKMTPLHQMTPIGHLTKVMERKTINNRIFWPGLPSYFFIYWSIFLQKESNERQSVYFALTIRKFDPEVIGEGHGAKNNKYRIFGPGVPSHFFVYWSTRLQKASNEQ